MAKILIVDDAAFMRMRCSKLLKENGHDVIEAENGLMAIEKYKAEKPDMVFMDVTMPEMDGITAVSEIRKLDSNAKIAMLSAMGQQSMVMDAIKAGARDFVVKPFQPEKVLSTIKKLIG
ncbi:MAG: two-component system response regulator [Candidatus Margulisiibacteriota bacterium]|nr:MAG: two-component system response regulator [Candidatus Margulisbacteria bacterium GWD2_39_127]OGI05486.1 MAG: two-component system response regulator [Candidatus Margulisbacteria bacterium GWF2_38_17]OGI08316.1 MAG: two-component system response regulator [Candidatus Margulisbacteria bacterium GWE2_39_32]PZM82312.1 MAG: two-component system response regulator [Candidatus Margulisiibacteriota bacterium]HAR62942.1 two-component system response regulator [Candidatus Margulisiibacteriota bacte